MAENTIIRVSGIETQRGGNLIIFIFGKDGYPKKHDKALHVQAVKADKAEMTFRFSLDLNEIAVKLLHDENEDGKVTKNKFGIYPAEGLGFSKGQRVKTFGPPKFKKSKVTKDEYLKGLEIEIRYPK
jgi:uncharacterized protein (DUF2141 family)